MYFDNTVHQYTCSKLDPHCQLVKTDQSVTKLIAFYKCCPLDGKTKQIVNCSFVTNVKKDLSEHMKRLHKGCQFKCVYCDETNVSFVFYHNHNLIFGF